MSYMKTLPNLPLVLLIEKQAADIQYGQITYTCKLRSGVVDMNDLNITVAKRKRYKIDKNP